MGRKYTGVLASARAKGLRLRCGEITKQRLVCAVVTAHPEAGGDAALDKNTRWHRGVLRLPDLDQGKGDQKHKGKHKQCDNTLFAPLDTVSSTGRENGIREGVSGSKLTAYVVPPHCRAKYRQMTPGRRASKPRTLSCCSYSLRLLVLGLLGI